MKETIKKALCWPVKRLVGSEHFIKILGSEVLVYWVCLALGLSLLLLFIMVIGLLLVLGVLQASNGLWLEAYKSLLLFILVSGLVSTLILFAMGRIGGELFEIAKRQKKSWFLAFTFLLCWALDAGRFIQARLPVDIRPFSLGLLLTALVSLWWLVFLCRCKVEASGKQKWILFNFKMLAGLMVFTLLFAAKGISQ